MRTSELMSKPLYEGAVSCMDHISTVYVGRERLKTLAEGQIAGHLRLQTRRVATVVRDAALVYCKLQNVRKLFEVQVEKRERERERKRRERERERERREECQKESEKERERER